MKARSSLPVSIRREIEQVVDDGDHAFAGSADVLHVFDVTLVAERAEAFADHHFGKADDGVERRADLVADPRQHVGLGAGGAIGQPPRLRNSLSLFLACDRSRNTAKKFGPSARVRPMVIDSGMMPPLRSRAQHLAAVVEQAGDVGRLDAGEIFEHAVLAFRREQLRQIALHKFVAVIAEQRFGAAVGAN